MKIRIGSRRSKLALLQTQLVVDMIKERNPDIEVEIVTMNTLGDRNLQANLTEIGGKGVFTRELEEAIYSREIDMAVHSAKDLPLEILEGIEVYPIGVRETSADILVTIKGSGLEKFCREREYGKEEKFQKYIIGTSSLRRSLQMQALYSFGDKSLSSDVCTIEILSIRGNIETRIQKLKSGIYDGILLAEAGLLRLKGKIEESVFQDLVYFKLDPKKFLPAACQGILALEVRKGEYIEQIQGLIDKTTEQSFILERAFLKEMASGCNAPCGIYTEVQNGKIQGIYTMYAREGKLKNIKYISDIYLNSYRSSNDFLSGIRKIVQKLKLGRVSLVGAGPGDKKLLTLQALECIQNADCIIYDNLISSSILNEAPFDAELIYAGKRAGKHSMKQEEIIDLLLKKAREGKYIVRLKGGDPFVFGRGGEEYFALREEGIEVDMVAGVSSCYAVPEIAGIPITYRGIASSFLVITGHEIEKLEFYHKYFSLAKYMGTIVILMGLRNIDEIARQLILYGKERTCPVAVISDGYGIRQEILISDLEHIAKKVEERKLTTPAIIIVGEVVKIHKDFPKWMEEVSTFSNAIKKNILITATQDMAKKMEIAFQKKGFFTTKISILHTLYQPSMELEKAIVEIQGYTWMIFTSSNGVNLFFKNIHCDFRKFAHLKFAVVGEGTAQTLRKYGYFADFIPSQYRVDTLTREFLPILSIKDKILLLRTKEGNPCISQGLQDRGIAYKEIGIYQTVYDRRRNKELLLVLPKIDYIAFASASGVRAFIDIIKIENRDLNIKEILKDLHIKVVCIGMETANICKEQGIEVNLIASQHSAEGMAEAIYQAENG